MRKPVCSFQPTHIADVLLQILISSRAQVAHIGNMDQAGNVPSICRGAADQWRFQLSKRGGQRRGSKTRSKYISMIYDGNDPLRYFVTFRNSVCYVCFLVLLIARIINNAYHFCKAVSVFGPLRLFR